MQVRFWGTRGSIPTPGHRTAIYGGNTSCVEVQATDGTTPILDCGTGLQLLGLDMLRRAAAHRIHLLRGHTHLGPLPAFAFFTHSCLPGTAFTIYVSVC